MTENRTEGERIDWGAASSVGGSLNTQPVVQPTLSEAGVSPAGVPGRPGGGGAEAGAGSDAGAGSGSGPGGLDAPTATPASDGGSQAYFDGDPVVPVPDDALHVSEDCSVEDEAVVVAGDGTVIDTRGETTVLTTSDGAKITVGSDGSVQVDPDIANDDEVKDITDLGVGASLTADSGLSVSRTPDGTVTIQQPNGQVLTVHPNGQVDLDVPDSSGDDGSGADEPGLGDGPEGGAGEGSDGTDDGAGEGDGTDEAPGGAGGPMSSGDEPGTEDEPGAGEEPGGAAEPIAPSAPGGGPSGGGPSGGGPSGGGSGGGGPSGGGPGGGGPSGGGSGGGGPSGGSDGSGGGAGDGSGGGSDDPSGFENGSGNDYEVLTEELRQDARYFEGLGPGAENLAACWESMAGLVQHWGLWFSAQGPFQEACRKFTDIYRSGANEMQRNAEALNDSADHYDQQEDYGAQCASQIGV